MILVDVNVLAYAHREDAPDHHAYREWLEGQINSDSAYGMSDLALSGFLRIVTHPKIFRPPSSLEQALAFVRDVRERSNCVPLHPGPRHFEIFTRLCERVGARGNLVPDAFFAALAIESGSEWISTDRDFARFPDLTWRHPLEV